MRCRRVVASPFDETDVFVREVCDAPVGGSRRRPRSGDRFQAGESWRSIGRRLGRSPSLIGAHVVKAQQTLRSRYVVTARLPNGRSGGDASEAFHGEVPNKTLLLRSVTHSECNRLPIAVGRSTSVPGAARTLRRWLGFVHRGSLAVSIDV